MRLRQQRKVSEAAEESSSPLIAPGKAVPNVDPCSVTAMHFSRWKLVSVWLFLVLPFVWWAGTEAAQIADADVFVTEDSLSTDNMLTTSHAGESRGKREETEAGSTGAKRPGPGQQPSSSGGPSSGEPQQAASDSEKATKVRAWAREWAVERVVVYRDTAEVQRGAALDLQAGLTELTLWGLPPQLLPNSIQVAGQGAATILEVREGQTALEAEELEARQALVDSLQAQVTEATEAVRRSKEQSKRGVEQVGEERRLVAGFVARAMTSEVEGLSASLAALQAAGWASLDDLLAYRRTKLQELDVREAELTRAAEEGAGTLERLSRELKEATAALRIDPKFRRTRQVTVVLEAATDLAAVVRVTYMTSGARWRALYEGRAVTDGSPASGGQAGASMALTYQAEVVQSTGEDWDNAQISLSTNQPTRGGELPPVPHTVITLDPPPEPMLLRSMGRSRRGDPEMNRKRKSSSRARSAMVSKSMRGGEELLMAMPMSMDGAEESMEMVMEEDEEDEMAADDMMGAGAEAHPMPEMGSVYAGVSEGSMGMVYDIARRASIPSDARPHKVVIGVVALESAFEYVAVPRSSAHAYLTMRGVNRSPLTLLPGPLSTFLDGTATSTTSLPRIAPQENFTLSFGVDEGVKVREVAVPKRDQSAGVMFIAETRKRTVTHLMSVANHKPQPIKIVVKDSLPVSTHKELKVTMEEHTSKGHQGTQLKFSKPSTEQCEWELEIPTGVEQELKLKFTIEWPHNKEVYGL